MEKFKGKVLMSKDITKDKNTNNQKVYWYTSRLYFTEVVGFLKYNKKLGDFNKEGKDYSLSRVMKIDNTATNIFSIKLNILPLSLEKNLIDEYVSAYNKDREETVKNALKLYNKDPKSINIDDVPYGRIVKVNGVNFEYRGYASPAFFNHDESVNYLNMDDGENEFYKNINKSND